MIFNKKDDAAPVVMIHDYIDAFLPPSDIDPDGDPIPNFRIGDRILMQRPSIIFPNRGYFPHEEYIVHNIDFSICRMTLWNPNLGQFDLTDYRTGIKTHGVLYKLPIKIEKPKPKVQAKAEVPVDPSKPRRGRPPGSKNKKHKGGTIKIKKKVDNS